MSEKRQDLEVQQSSTIQMLKIAGIVVAVLIDLFLLWQLIVCWGVLK